jgi:hypothetical protein
MFRTNEAAAARNRRAQAAVEPEADKPTDKTASEAKRKKFYEDLSIMQQEYLNSDETADQKLKKLRDQWNPLLDPVKRDNLVEDVNSLCRDMLRRMRYTRTMQAPDRKRIEEIAKRIAGNTAFDRITRRKAFETYLKLYLLTVLQRM